MEVKKSYLGTGKTVMIERIVILLGSPFNLRDYQRFGIECLQENGFRVEAWDLTPIVNLKLSQNYTPPDAFDREVVTVFSDRSEAYRKLSNLSQTDLVISHVGYNFESLGTYRALSKSDADYALSYANALPEPKATGNWLHLLERKIRELLSYRYPRSWKRLFMKLPPQWLGIRPATLVLTGGASVSIYARPIDKTTKILNIHTLDYDLYLKQKDIPCAKKSTAVFLDEFMPFHPDFVMVGERSPVTPDRYYRLLNDFFDVVEEKTGLKIIIAAHPRSNYEDLPDYFKGRKRVKGKTIELIKECRLVLAHCSTAINFANLFYKPIIFVSCSDFERTYVDYWITEMAKWHGKIPIFMGKNNGLGLKKELMVNKKHYDNYRKAYIKAEHSEDLPFWQIVANSLKKESEE